MTSKTILAAGAALAAFALPTVEAAAQESIEEVASAFGVRPDVLDISIAPSGEKIAYISPNPDGAELVYVVDLATGEGAGSPITRYAQAGADLTRCEWPTDERLVCRAYVVSPTDNNVLISFTRIFSMKADGTDFRPLTAPISSRSTSFNYHGGSIVALDVEGEENKILLSRDWVEEITTGSRIASDDEGLGVELIDIETGRRTRAEAPDPNAISYIADENGNIRLKIARAQNSAGTEGGSQRIFYYREPGSNRWQEMSRSDRFAGFVDGFEPYSIDSASNVAYGYMVRDGYEGVYSLALDGSGTVQPVHVEEGVDVDRIVRIGRQRRVVGTSYATDKRYVNYTDEELGTLAGQLSQALPGNPSINFVDATADERKLIIKTSSDIDPGMFYLLDRDTMALTEIMPAHSSLSGRTLAEMRSVTYPAADGTQIPAYLTLPVGSDGTNLPAIVLPHGGPSSRDVWGFDWLVQFFAARGYAVLQPNYRGSAGYGLNWMQRNGFRDWEIAIGDVNDAGRWLVSEGIADPEKLAGVGWSYGGYAVLQSQVLDPELFQAIVAIAPVTDLDALVEGRRYYSNYRAWDEFMGDGPHRQEGSPTRYAAQFQAPVLMFHGTYDLNTWVEQSRLMEQRLRSAGKPVQLVEYDERDHSIRDGWARANMLRTIDTFLEENLAD